MREKLLKLARRQLWKYRLMLWWRSVATGLGFVYLVFWILSPMLLAMYFAKSHLSLLILLCFPALFMNFLYANSEDGCINRTADRLSEERKLLKLLISSAKDAAAGLKEMRTKKLDMWELDSLQDSLADIGVDADADCFATWQN